MAQRKTPLWLIWEGNDSHISKSIYRELEIYAKDTGFYPSQRGLFYLMTQGRWVRNEKGVRVWIPPRYTVTLASFNHWFDRLVNEGYVAIDDRTRSISCTGLIIIEKDTRSAELD